MLPNVESIKQMRQKLGITQKKLASMTGVSTSMINQIESGRSQPSYETAKKIFENLSNLESRSSSHKAGDFCSQDIVKMKPSNTLHDAIKKMHELSISQIGTIYLLTKTLFIVGYIKTAIIGDISY